MMITWLIMAAYADRYEVLGRYGAATEQDALEYAIRKFGKNVWVEEEF